MPLANKAPSANPTSGFTIYGFDADGKDVQIPFLALVNLTTALGDPSILPFGERKLIKASNDGFPNELGIGDFEYGIFNLEKSDSTIINIVGLMRYEGGNLDQYDSWSEFLTNNIDR